MIRLGEIHPSKYRQCIACARAIMNKRHDRCHHSYNKVQHDNIRGDKQNTIDEYHANMNANMSTIQNI